MAAKRFQVRTEEEIERSKLKVYNKATHTAVKTLKEFCKEENLQQIFDEPNKMDVNFLLSLSDRVQAYFASTLISEIGLQFEKFLLSLSFFLN